MDYKTIDKADSKLIDEVPRSRSKKAKRRKRSGESSIKRDFRFPSVQIIAPIFIAALGIAVTQLVPDKLPLGSEPDVGTAQVLQTQAGIRATPSAGGNGKGSPSPGSQATRRPSPLTNRTVGTSSTANVDKDKNKIEMSSNQPSAAEAVTQEVGENQVSLVSAVVCDGIQDRQPLAEKQSFTTSDSQRVYVWMEVRSKSQPFVVKHKYYLNGQKHHEFPLEIKYPRMRTWSYMTIDNTDHIGHWRVEIVCNDHILKTVEYMVGNGAQ